MDRTLASTQWKDRDTSQQVSTGQGDFSMVTPLHPMQMADPAFISRCTWNASLRYAVQRSGFDDYEVADEIAVSHSYMSKILKGTAGLHGQRLVRFMRHSSSLASLQWIAERVGAEIVLRDRRAAEVAELRARLTQLEGGGL